MRTTLSALLLACSYAAWAQNPNPLRVNQVGYAPADSKTAAVELTSASGNDAKNTAATPFKTFTLTDEASGKRVWKGKAVRTALSPWSGKTRAIIDFSKVTNPGTYLLSGGGHTQRVVIADHPYRDLAVAAAKAFYLQRMGEPILEKHAGEYARPAAHMDDHVMVHASAASASRPEGTIIACPGGWYDAGDYNKYVVNSAFSIAIMLDAYEMNRNYFDTLELNIPESGNGTPDLLDELAVNLRWMLTMQDPEDGGVYHKLTTPNFEPFIRPEDCRQQRYVVQKSTAAALDFAATMAKAYRVYSQFPEYKAWAEGALEQGKRAYDWARQHPADYYRQDAMNERHDPDITTGTYGDEHIDDELLWAEIELFLATGSERFIHRLASAYQTLHFSNPSWGGVTGLGFYSAAAAVKEGKMPYAYEVKGFLRQQICGVADGYLATMDNSCFDSPCGNLPSDFGWGCNGEQVCGKGIILLHAYELTGDAKYLHAARKVADYLLGRNATGYCFVTGFGTFSPQHPHHRLSESDGIVAPLPGFLVGGPNPGQQDKATAGKYPSDYPDESYLDAMPSYASNEIAINWNATLVAFIGWLDALDGR